MDNPVILHCNYVEQGQTIDEMCELAVKWGFDGIEFRQKRFDVEEEPGDYLDAVEKAVASSGLKHVLFGAPGPDLMLDDADARKREVDTCIAFFRDAAKRFDLTVCNTMAGTLKSDAPYMEFDKHGSAIATDAQFQNTVEGFQVLGDLALELGFRFAFELHNVYIHDLPAPARKLVDAIDRDSVGLNIDFGNIVIYPGNTITVEEGLEICKGRTYLLHLKNLYKIGGLEYLNWIMCPLADGIINNRELLRIVKGQGYDGPIVIEQPREGDRSWYAPEDLAYIRSVMGDLG